MKLKTTFCFSQQKQNSDPSATLCLTALLYKLSGGFSLYLLYPPILTPQLHSLPKSSVDELKTKAKNLSQIYKADLDSSNFQSEMTSFKYQAAAMMENFEKFSPINILQLIHKYLLTDAYPNTAIAIRIFLTISVTVATSEKSFSKLKLIKD